MSRDHAGEKRTLHKALRDAKRTLKLSTGAYVTAQELIARIPAAAPSAVSPANVTELARHTGVSPKTINNHTRELIRLGLVRNACLGGGRRHCQYDHRGRLIAVYGIDLSPLLERAEELAARSEQKQEAATEHRCLRATVSATRRAIRQLLGTASGREELRAWTSLPRRIAHLCLDELQNLARQTQDLLFALMSGRKEIPHRPDEDGQPYITLHKHSYFCNRTMPTQKNGRQDALRPTCGLEHISLRQAVLAAPADWRDDMALHGHETWHGFLGTAYQRAIALGINPSVWSQAQAAIGMQGAGILVMLADANSVERGGIIRSVGGWMRRMTERAEEGTAHLHRSVYALLNREGAE